MWNSLVILVIALVLSFAAAPAEAVQKWLGFLPPLTDEDMALAQNAAREGMAGQPEGTKLEWSNPESGNSGTVTLLQRYEVDQRECRKLEHGLKIKGESDRRIYIVTICLQPDGSWKWP
jgi:surface antigen